MRNSLIVRLAIIAALPCLGSAQGVITSLQQSVDSIGTQRLAMDGEYLAHQDPVYRLDQALWVPIGELPQGETSMDLDGGRFLIGKTNASPGGFGAAGNARIWTRINGAWVLEWTLVASDVRPNWNLGGHVGLSRYTAVVSAPGWRPVGQPWYMSVGAVYVFRLVNGAWVEDAILPPGVGDSFDSQVAIDGDTLAVAGTSAGGAGCTGDVVFVFQRTGSAWHQVAALPFGGCVRFDSEVLVQEDLPGRSTTIVTRSSGVTVVHTGYDAGWERQDLALDSAGGIAISGSVLAIGDLDDAVDGSGASGSVRLFRRDSAGTWSIKRRLFGSEPRDRRRFGRYLAMDGESLAVGSEGFGTPYPTDMAVDIFRIVPIDATEYCVGIPNSTGEVARIASSGHPSVSANAFELVAGPVPSSLGLFFYGAGQIRVPPAGC